MPNKTKNYKLESLKRGELYGEGIDYRRFFTMDYNLESYIGIVGIGIISGWTIEHVNGLTIKILPGTGIIDGYYAESEYSFKKRSEIVSGEREIEVVSDDDIPEPPLTGNERTNYINVIKEYDSGYIDPTVILNSYIKTVTPTEITLDDDSDVYIVATRNHSKPYPDLLDLPVAGEPPSSNGEKTYTEYLAEITAYNNAIKAVHDYQWRANIDNHFTSVSFSIQLTYVKSSSNILLGKVITRGGNVKKIDLKMVDSLANLNSAIKEKSSFYVNGHIHGGDGAFDPPKVNLKSGIRKAALTSYNSNGQVCSFEILEDSETSVSVGHRHNYKIDSDGNGYTVEKTGDGIQHFHKISSFIVKNQEATSGTIENHIHDIPNLKSEIGINNTYVVYLNGIPIAKNVSVDLSKEQIVIYGLVGEIYKTYSTSFQVTPSSTNVPETYSFEQASFSVLSYMLSMQNDYYKKYQGDEIASLTSANNPFGFVDNHGNYSGYDDIKSQSEIAQIQLKDIGDEFIFTPNATKNISVFLNTSSLPNLPSNYDVKIEIFGTVEITGILRGESIAFINSEKFDSGVFDIARIPPLNHIGRMGEEFLSIQSPLTSSDGIKYSVSPSITSVTLNHYHKLNLDRSLSGTTNNTYVSEDPVYYAYSNGVSYLIDHIHNIENGYVASSDGRDLAEWQTAISGSNSSSNHIHSIIESIKGDPKVIYSLAETPNGSILAGTSSGLYIIPSGMAYLFVINGESIYQIGDNLWELLLKSKEEYGFRTSKKLIITEDPVVESYYINQIQLAEKSLLTDGDSVLLLGYVDPIEGQDQIMIQRTEQFLLPKFKSSNTKLLSEVTDEEIVTNVTLQYPDGTTITQEAINASPLLIQSAAIEFAYVESDLQNMPVWSVISDSGGDVYVCGAQLYSKNSNIENNLYTNWTNSIKPINAFSFREIYKDSNDNVWIPTENGLLVARNNQNGRVVETSNNHSWFVNIFDVAEGVSGTIYVANENGISVTSDYGKTWDFSLTVAGGCIKVLKDVGSNKLYAISKFLNIYEFIGVEWNIIGNLISKEIGDVIALNGYFYVCSSDGLYRNQVAATGQWTKVLDGFVSSIGLLKNNDGILVGSDQKIYESFDGIVYSEITTINGSAAPSLYVQDSKKRFGYAFSNKKEQFLFKETEYSEDPFSSMVYFNTWLAKNGSWNDSAPIDIYINRELIYSTKSNVDKRKTSNYQFSIMPSQGMINFNISTELESPVKINDDFILVKNSDGFTAGDRIYVVSSSSIPEKPTKPSSIINWMQYYKDLEQYYKDKDSIENMFFYAEVIAVFNNRIILDRSIAQNIYTPANVYKMVSLSSSSSIFANIYESMLLNVGVNTHESIDNKISYASDSRPYQLNNSYLSNLLQLTQAIKYAYPDIDQNMPKIKMFDFKYSWDQFDINRPYIGDVIDLNNSEIYNDGIYNSKFVKNGSRMINKILIGHGTFDNIIIVGTDIGVFYATFSESMESNWFYAYNLMIPVYDLLIVNSNTLIAATNEGLYKSINIQDWLKFEQPQINLPIYSLSYRWGGRKTVKIDSHLATFTNVDGNGIITASTSLYGAIEANRIIKVIGLTDLSKNGEYNVLVATDKDIKISGTFPDDVPITISVIIEMGAWWEYLTSDVSTNDSNIKNTLLAGGLSTIAFATNVSSGTLTNEITWRQSKTPSDINNFSSSNICPLSNGQILISINSELNNEKNNILSCVGLGTEWNHFLDLVAVKGIISSYKPTNMGHTILNVSYSTPTDYVCQDTILNGREIAFFNNSLLIYKSYVCFNSFVKGSNQITIFGQEIVDLIKKYTKIEFVIYPQKVNRMLETTNNVVFATNNGIYDDEGSTIYSNKKHGSISKVSDGGLIVSIDINGLINSISSNAISGNAVVNISTNDSIFNNQLVNNIMYISGIETPYKIISNSSKKPNGEISIEINVAFSDTWSKYNSKKVVIQGENSKVYVSFSGNIKNNQFKNGKMYYADGSDSKGIQILSSTNSYIIINGNISPEKIGEEILIVDSSNKIKLYVSFSEDILLNQLSGLNFGSYYSNLTAVVYSNTSTEIVLRPINFNSETETNPIFGLQDITSFFVYGNIFSSNNGFNDKTLSITNDHYHLASLIGQRLKGTIESAIQNGSGYIDITVIDPEGFNNEILLSDETAIEGCKVRFYNPINLPYEFETTSVSYVAPILKVNVSDSSMWNLTEYDETKASPLWKIEIESQHNGISNQTFYNDFNAITRQVTSDIVYDVDEISVNSTADIIVGDKIKIENTTGRSFITYVSGISSALKLQISPSSDNTFLVIENSVIKVLRDSFSNNHTHRIRNSQIETVVVDDYVNRGYESSHYHMLAPYISNVSDIIANEENIFAVGSNKTIYISYNSGSEWKPLIDINKSLEWNEEIEGISRILNHEGLIIVGTTNGQIFSSTNKGWLNIPLNIPL